MKKLVLFLAVAFGAAMVSCGGSEKAADATDTVATDTVVEAAVVEATDSVVADSAAIDTTVVEAAVEVAK